MNTLAFYRKQAGTDWVHAVLQNVTAETRKPFDYQKKKKMMMMQAKQPKMNESRKDNSNQMYL